MELKAAEAKIAQFVWCYHLHTYSTRQSSKAHAAQCATSDAVKPMHHLIPQTWDMQKLQTTKLLQFTATQHTGAPPMQNSCSCGRTSFFRFFSIFWNLESSLSWSALMRLASSRSRLVWSCSSRSMACFCFFSRFSTSWSYWRFLACVGRIDRCCRQSDEKNLGVYVRLSANQYGH